MSARNTFERASRISRGVRALIIPPALPGVAISASSFRGNCAKNRGYKLAVARQSDRRLIDRSRLTVEIYREE